jgi:hypothetical protein
MRTLLCALLVWLVGTAAAWAQGPGPSTLGGLIFPRGGKVLHFSSTDPKGGNDDSRPIAPGQTLTLVDYKGAGIVRRWWVTVAPRNNRQIQRQAIIRCYWDGETSPSVEVPLSDFFGMGFGEWKDYISLPLNMTSGGYNCYWPMPFHHSARITVENRSPVKIDALYYNIDVETHPTLPKDILYFHAQFRRSDPTVSGQPYTILDTTGSGQYVGTLLSMQKRRGGGFSFLEGDEQVTVDGERTPSILGTGTEDYFSSGWYFDTGVYSAPYHGVTIKDEAQGRISAYRWHIEDAIPFTKSIRFNIEHGTNNSVAADYSSVAFYYQTHPHPPFPPLPADLMPHDVSPIPHVPGMIEGESLVGTAQATEGEVSVQDMSDFESGDWSGSSQLWWRPTQIGSRLTLSVPVSETKDYELVGYFTQAADYGDVQVSVNGQALAPIVRGYHDGVIPTGPVSFGRVALHAGSNSFVLEVVGKDAHSANYLVGLDGFVLKP